MKCLCVGKQPLRTMSMSIAESNSRSRGSSRGDMRVSKCVRDNKGRRETVSPTDVRGISSRVSRRGDGGGGMQRSGAGRGWRPLLPRRHSLLPAPRASPPRASDTSAVLTAQGRHLHSRTQVCLVITCHIYRAAAEPKECRVAC